MAKQVPAGSVVQAGSAPTKIKVAPHLVVEILSPSTSGNDQTIQKDLYKRSGVAERQIDDCGI